VISWNQTLRLNSCSVVHMRRLPRISAGTLAWFAASIFAMVGIAEAESSQQVAQRNVVLELFTSQGSSSCPAADALLGKFGRRPGILVLSYSMDYWDYLGWRDTLARPANRERQRQYARMRGDGWIYTPQLVVDGLIHVNGRDEEAIEMAIEAAAVRLAGIKVSVNLRAESDSLVTNIGAAPDHSDRREATVWLAIAKEVETVRIARGENEGQEVSYHHPVRNLVPIGMWKGEAITLRLPLKDLKTRGGDYLMVLLQVEGAGPILGAAEYDQL
jgi:hypothetical protein